MVRLSTGSVAYAGRVAHVDLAVSLEATLRDVGAFFVGDSRVQQAAAELGARLDGAGIDYAIAGALCLGAHGGLPKPVRFPEPAAVWVAAGSLRVLSLSRLIELKLASGMTAPHRLQDLADVLRLIEKLGLDPQLAEQLDPFVRAKYLELWANAQHPEDDY